MPHTPLKSFLSAPGFQGSDLCGQWKQRQKPSRVKMNPTDGPSFPSPFHPGLTDGLRKKADAATSLGNRILAPGNSVRRGQGQPPRTSKWRKFFGVERITSLWRIKRREAKVHILLFSHEKQTADFPRNNIDLFFLLIGIIWNPFIFIIEVWISVQEINFWASL